MGALEALAAGECAIIGTDTVYGLAALPGSEGESRIYQIKGRPRDMKLPWLVSGTGMLERLSSGLAPYTLRLVEMFWPGALTVVVDTPQGSVAMRCPDDEACMELMRRLDSPLACTSANLHGQPTALCADALPEAFCTLAGFDELPPCCGGQASTIVDCTGPSPVILREGPIPAGVLWDVAVFDDTL